MSEWPTVLDASAVLALLFREPGGQRVEAVIARAVVSTVNWLEVCQKLLDRGADLADAQRVLLDAGMKLEVLTAEDAERAASLRAITRDAGLSLADRCCLALAERLERTALTADAAWMSLPVSVEIELIRSVT